MWSVSSAAHTTRVLRRPQYERQANSFKHAFFESILETATTKLTSKKSKGKKGDCRWEE